MEYGFSVVVFFLEREIFVVSVLFSIKEIDEWTDYNNERIKLHEMKAADGAIEAQKVRFLL